MVKLYSDSEWVLDVVKDVRGDEALRTGIQDVSMEQLLKMAAILLVLTLPYWEGVLPPSTEASSGPNEYIQN